MQSAPNLARRYVVAGLQVFGGLYGFAAVADFAVNTPAWHLRLISGLLLAFYATCFVGGVMLLRDDDRGASLSLYLQFPQLIVLQSTYFNYNVFVGASAPVAVLSDFSFHFGLQWGAGALSAATDSESGALGINVWALVTLRQLYQYLEAKDAAAAPVQAPSQAGTD